MKKALALVLSLLLLMSGTVALASDYEDPVSVSISSCFLTSGKDYTSDALAQYFLEKFNLELDVWINDNSTHDQTTRTWVNGGTMPDVTQWMSFNVTEYRDWVDQGLIAPLPEGWENTYPNLYKMVQKTGLYDVMKIDGITYGFPHAGICNFVDMEHRPAHTSVYYRLDWAKKLGCEWTDGVTVTLSQLHEYLKGCIEKDFSNTGATLGITGTASNVLGQFMNFCGFNYSGFIADNETAQYYWGPSYRVEEAVKPMELARAWYKEGVIDPDFYLYKSASEAENIFAAGKAAAQVGDGPVNHYVELFAAFDEANPGMKGEDVISSAVLTDDDGVAYTSESTNYWTVTLFSPDATEEEINRILAVADYGCTVEGEIITQLGLKDVDWTYDENGDVVALNDATGSVNEYNSYYIWTFLNILSDDFAFVNPAYSKDIREHVMAIYDAKGEGKLIPFNYDYAFYSSDAKSVYSVDIMGKITEMVITDVDILESWNAFIADNAGMVDPLVAELTEYFY